MIAFSHAGAAAALLALTAVARPEARDHRARFTLTGGPHAGGYELTSAAMCDVHDVRGKPPRISGHFAPERQRQRDGSPAAVLDYFYLYTLRETTDKPDVVAFGARFKGPSGSRKDIEYKVYTIPPALQEKGLEMEREGRGTVTVRRTDTGAIATFRGETKDGIRIEGSVECGG